jgi:hypothetical protein
VEFLFLLNTERNSSHYFISKSLLIQGAFSFGKSEFFQHDEIEKHQQDYRCYFREVKIKFHFIVEDIDNKIIYQQGKKCNGKVIAELRGNLHFVIIKSPQLVCRKIKCRSDEKSGDIGNVFIEFKFFFTGICSRKIKDKTRAAYHKKADKFGNDFRGYKIAIIHLLKE